MLNRLVVLLFVSTVLHLHLPAPAPRLLLRIAKHNLFFLLIIYFIIHSRSIHYLFICTPVRQNLHRFGGNNQYIQFDFSRQQFGV
jgi:hypothetical protein